MIFTNEFESLISNLYPRDNINISVLFGKTTSTAS